MTIVTTLITIMVYRCSCIFRSAFHWTYLENKLCLINSFNIFWVNPLLHWLHKNGFLTGGYENMILQDCSPLRIWSHIPYSSIVIANVELHVPFEIFPTGKPLLLISDCQAQFYGVHKLTKICANSYDFRHFPSFQRIFYKLIIQRSLSISSFRKSSWFS